MFVFFLRVQNMQILCRYVVFFFSSIFEEWMSKFDCHDMTGTVENITQSEEEEHNGFNWKFPKLNWLQADMNGRRQ